MWTTCHCSKDTAKEEFKNEKPLLIMGNYILFEKCEKVIQLTDWSSSSVQIYSDSVELPERIYFKKPGEYRIRYKTCSRFIDTVFESVNENVLKNFITEFYNRHPEKVSEIILLFKDLFSENSKARAFLYSENEVVRNPNYFKSVRFILNSFYNSVEDDAHKLLIYIELGNHF